MLDLGTVIDPKTIKTELSLLKKEAKEAKESPTQKSSSPTPSKTTSNKADKAEKAKIYNFNDDPSKENSPEPEMQGNAEEEGEDNDWCAVCHDGGDTLYCCDRCPKVYHMYCFIPPLTEEPPDDWVCLN